MPKILEGAKTPLELLNRSENRWGVVGTCNANDTVLRRPDQLLLTPENHHFAGSMHLTTEGAVERITRGPNLTITKMSKITQNGPKPRKFMSEHVLDVRNRFFELCPKF